MVIPVLNWGIFSVLRRKATTKKQATLNYKRFDSIQRDISNTKCIVETVTLNGVEALFYAFILLQIFSNSLVSRFCCTYESI